MLFKKYTFFFLYIAAHCFWDEQIKAKKNVSDFKIAAGKFYRIYYLPERYAQESDIRDIYIPQKYYGVDGLQAQDIAWLILERPMIITDFVRPVCLDMINERQWEDLRVGRTGKVSYVNKNRNIRTPYK